MRFGWKTSLRLRREPTSSRLPANPPIGAMLNVRRLVTVGSITAATAGVLTGLLHIAGVNTDPIGLWMLLALTVGVTGASYDALRQLGTAMYPRGDLFWGLSLGLFIGVSTVTTAVLDLGVTQTIVLGEIIFFTGVNGVQLGWLGRLRAEAKRDDASVHA